MIGSKAIEQVIQELSTPDALELSIELLGGAINSTNEQGGEVDKAYHDYFLLLSNFKAMLHQASLYAANNRDRLTPKEESELLDIERKARRTAHDFLLYAIGSC